MSKAALKTSGANRKNRHACAIFPHAVTILVQTVVFPPSFTPFNIHRILFTDVSLLHGSYDIQELDLRHESKIEIILKKPFRHYEFFFKLDRIYTPMKQLDLI